MKVRQLQAGPGQLIQVGRTNFASVGAQVGKADVIDNNQQDIGLLSLAEWLSMSIDSAAAAPARMRAFK